MKRLCVIFSVIAAALLVGCRGNKTIELEPINIAVDATAHNYTAATLSEELDIGQESTSMLVKGYDMIASQGTIGGDIALGCASFFYKEGRWPSNFDELAEEYYKAGQSPESFEKLKAINFIFLPSGDLEVNYQAEGAHKGTITLTKPNSE